jgi:hypothetical protein
MNQATPPLLRRQTMSSRHLQQALPLALRRNTEQQLQPLMPL